MTLPDPLHIAGPARAEADAQPPHALRAPTIEQVIGLMPGFVYVFDHETGENVYTNRSVGVHLGYSSEEIRAMGSAMMMHVIHPDDAPLIETHLAQIADLADGRQCTVDYRVLTKTNKVIWLRSVDAVFDRAANGRVLRHIGCASDMTGKKEAVLRLAELNADLEAQVAQRTQAFADLNTELEMRISERTVELENALSELEDITYTATHDLKVPVNNLCRLGHMLEQSTDTMTQEQAEDVAWISTCAQQLNDKIAALVRISQIRLADEPKFLPSDLSVVARKTLHTLRPALVQSGAKVDVDIPSDSWVSYCPVEIDSVLEAVVDNAVRYADPARPARIVLKFSQEPDGPTLSVADNGTGLSLPADLPKVFGLFQRAHKAPHGDGMALHCAQRRIKRAGGQITVSSTKGQGAEFKIVFRKEEAPDGAA